MPAAADYDAEHSITKQTIVEEKGVDTAIPEKAETTTNVAEEKEETKADDDTEQTAERVTET